MKRLRPGREERSARHVNIVVRGIVDGLWVGGPFTLVAVGSLWLDARVWIADYPPDIQAAVGPDVAAPLWLQSVTAVLLLAVLIGGPVWSNRRTARDSGWATGFGSVFGQTMILLWVVNAVDVVVVDWIIFVTLQPDFAVLPGTEGLAGYHDYGFHLMQSVGSWQPWAASLTLAALLAIVLPLTWRHRRSRETSDPQPSTT